MSKKLNQVWWSYKAFAKEEEMNNTEKKPKYAMRKLSIGLVSCMLGFTLMAIPSHSFASGGAESKPTQVEEAQKAEPEEAPTKEAPREEAKAEEISTEVLSETSDAKNEAETVEEKEEKPEDGKNESPEDTQTDQGKGSEVENGAPTKDNDDLQVGDKIKTVNVREPQETENKETAEFLFEFLVTKEGHLVKTNEESYETDARKSVNINVNTLSPEEQALIKNIKFNIYSLGENGVKVEKTGVVPELGDENRWSGAFYIRGLEKNKKYLFQVDPSSLPDGYHSYFKKGSSNPNPDIEMGLANGSSASGSLAVFDTSNTEDGKKYGHARLHLDVLDIIFARNEETAKNIFKTKKWKSENDGKTYTDIIDRNNDLKEGEDYYKTRVGKDYSIDVPDINKYANEGYRPLNWYITYPDWKNEDGSLKKYDINYLIKGRHNTGRPFDGYYHSQDEINYTDVRLKANTTIFTLDQQLPNGTFNYNNTEDGTPAEEVSQDIYYKKSLADNKLSTGKEIERKVGTPTRKGYKFKGWNTQADGKGKAFDENTLVTDEFLDKDGKFTVYAQWEKVPDNPVDPPVKPSDDKPSGPIYTPSDDYIPSTPIVDTDEDDDGIRELIEEFDKLNKETPDNNSKERPEETPSEKEEKPKDENKENKEDMTNPTKSKDQKGDKVRNSGMKANPKTGVTGSAAVAALGLSSLFASLGLRKKND